MQELIHIRGKLLGVDFGDKRTGLAVSDEGQRMASGICQIQVGGMQKTAAGTARSMRERACRFWRMYSPSLKAGLILI